MGNRAIFFAARLEETDIDSCKISCEECRCRTAQGRTDEPHVSVLHKTRGKRPWLSIRHRRMPAKPLAGLLTSLGTAPSPLGQSLPDSLFVHRVQRYGMICDKLRKGAPMSLTLRSSTNSWKRPMAFDPPPTHASRTSGLPPHFSWHCALTSRPITA
jgi:hypothetical protein